MLRASSSHLGVAHLGRVRQRVLAAGARLLPPAHAHQRVPLRRPQPRPLPPPAFRQQLLCLAIALERRRVVPEVVLAQPLVELGRPERIRSRSSRASASSQSAIAARASPAKRAAWAARASSAMRSTGSDPSGGATRSHSASARWKWPRASAKAYTRLASRPASIEAASAAPCSPARCQCSASCATDAFGASASASRSPGASGCALAGADGCRAPRRSAHGGTKRRGRRGSRTSRWTSSAARRAAGRSGDPATRSSTAWSMRPPAAAITPSSSPALGSSRPTRTSTASARLFGIASPRGRPRRAAPRRGTGCRRRACAAARRAWPAPDGR